MILLALLMLVSKSHLFQLNFHLKSSLEVLSSVEVATLLEVPTWREVLPWREASVFQIPMTPWL